MNDRAMNDRHVRLHYAPHSRAGSALVLLHELGADFELHAMDLQKGEQREAAYLAVNPMGKVPAIEHGGALVSEQGAVYTYLADLYPEAGLAPPIGDPLRGPYLRWMFFYGSSFEPALIDKSMKREAAPPATSPYGTVETTLAVVDAQIERADPWWLGDRFTALDVLWGGALRWMTQFKLVEATPKLSAYLERVTSRPSFAKAAATEAEVLAAQGHAG